MALYLSTSLKCGITFLLIRLMFGKVGFTEGKMMTVNCDGENEYKHSDKHGVVYCSPCSKCLPGTGMVTPCSDTSDTVCLPCRNGTFSHGGYKSCKPCRHCKGESHVARKCKPHKNTHCRTCKHGRYFSKEMHKCRKCRKCPPGTYIKRKCSPLHNTECSPCPIGTFSDRYNRYPFCMRCKRCRTFEQILQVCNPTQNNICGNCKPGFFRLESTLNCAKCSYCYPESPGYTFPIPECVDSVNDSLYTCMPMLRPPPIKRPVVTTYSLTMESTSGFIQSSSTERIDQKTEEEHIPVKLLVIISIAVVFIVLIILGMLCSRSSREISSHNFTKSSNTDFTSISSSYSEPILSNSYCEEFSKEYKYKQFTRGSKSYPDKINEAYSEDRDNFINEYSLKQGRICHPACKSTNQGSCYISSSVGTTSNQILDWSKETLSGNGIKPCINKDGINGCVYSDTYCGTKLQPLSDCKRLSCYN